MPHASEGTGGIEARAFEAAAEIAEYIEGQTDVGPIAARCMADRIVDDIFLRFSRQAGPLPLATA
jgi:hypothetical protein